MNLSKPGDIDGYIAAFPENTQKLLQQVRRCIKNLVPAAEETISYGIPTFLLNDGYLIYFAGYKKHISIYPAPRNNEAFKEELSAYKGGKGTVQFPIDKPIPFDLITRIIKFRIKENEAKTKKKTVAVRPTSRAKHK